MTLDQFLNDQNLSDGAFAAMVGRDRTTVMRIRKGLSRPDWTTLCAIVKATDGAVTPNDFLNIDQGETPVSAPPRHLSHKRKGGKRDH